MLLRQLFHHETYSFTYLIADRDSGVAAIIDPVRDDVEKYLRLVAELGVELKFALDTHVHADHITALGRLRELTGCTTYLGNREQVHCADSALEDGMKITLGRLTVMVMYTPGHTDDSYCFYIDDGVEKRVFTGDTLLIRGTGRTDFQNGCAANLYDSLHQKVMLLEPATIVYPGHDYNGSSTSTIDEEKHCNPRITIDSKEAFVSYMRDLNLSQPGKIDIAVPANQRCGRE
ncbi:Zn-dependent hydrolase [Gammaproteobacteria bacterium 45_16_T64]|nr:Zn-dependent hydrolase [Gammaproteobacteria bacterium 45_16_T64]